jgi:hypothetical protein
MDEPKVGYNHLIGQVSMPESREPEEPSNYHRYKRYEENLIGVERFSANETAESILIGLERDCFKLAVNDNVLQTERMGTIYEKIRNSGKIRSIELIGFLNGKVAQRAIHTLDSIKLIKYITHYNKNVKEIFLYGFSLDIFLYGFSLDIFLYGFSLDIFLLVEILKIKTLTKLIIKSCEMRSDIFLVLMVALFENTIRIEYLYLYFNNLVNNAFYSKQDEDLSSLLSDVNNLPNLGLKVLNIDSIFIEIHKYSYNDFKEGLKIFDNAICKMLETNCCLRSLNFPLFFKFSKTIDYETVLESNYSITTTNLSNTSLIINRNEKILETTKKSCLTLIGIKKLRWNNSKEFKMLNTLDNNIVKMIGFYVFQGLKNRRSHLEILASKV